MCSSPRPNLSTAPLSTKAIAWIGLLAERGRISASMSPHDATTVPSGFTTAAVALVPALDQRPARDFDDDRLVAHSSRSSLMTVTLSWCGAGSASTASISACTGFARSRRDARLVEALHAVAAQQQPGARAQPSAAFVDQGQGVAHHRLAQRVAAGMVGRLPGGEQAARHHRVDLRRHRVVRVQPLDLAVRRRGRAASRRR